MGKGEENSITPSNGDYINDVCTPLSCNTDVTPAAYNRQQLSCRHYGVDQLHNITIAGFLKVRTYIMYPLSHMEPPFLMVLLI